MFESMKGNQSLLGAGRETLLCCLLMPFCLRERRTSRISDAEKLKMDSGAWVGAVKAVVMWTLGCVGLRGPMWD